MSQDYRNIFNTPKLKISIGREFAQAVCFGRNKNSELGFLNVQFLDTPQNYSQLDKIIIKSVSCWGNHLGVVTEQGELFLAGESILGKLGKEINGNKDIYVPIQFQTQETVQDIVCSDGFSLCLLQSGQVWSWGGTLYKKGGSQIKPMQIERLSKFIITQIACGVYHSICLSQEGVLFSWGGGGDEYNQGQLGHGNKQDCDQPKPINFFMNSKIVLISCGDFFSYAIDDNKKVYSWGSGMFGELGSGRYENVSLPQEVELFENKKNNKGYFVVSISCGKRHALLLTNKNLVFATGWNAYGQLGLGHYDNCSFPKQVSLDQISQISCGKNHCLVMNSKNQIYSVGQNQFGQLGLGHQKNQCTYQLLSEVENQNIKTIIANGDHSWIIFNQISQINFTEYSQRSNMLSNKDLSQKSWSGVSNKNQEHYQRRFQTIEPGEQEKIYSIGSHSQSVSPMRNFQSYNQYSKPHDKNIFTQRLESNLSISDSLLLNNSDECSQRGLQLGENQMKTSIVMFQNINGNLLDKNEWRMRNDIDDWLVNYQSFGQQIMVQSMRQLELKKSLKEIKESQQILSETEICFDFDFPIQSSYFLLFQDIDYFQKYIIVECDNQSQDQVELQLQKCIQKIHLEENNIVDYQINTYESLNSQSCQFVLLLIQNNTNIIEQNNIERKDYDNLQKYKINEEQIMYFVTAEFSELSPNWRIFSKSYEILQQTLSCLVKQIRIYEIRPLNYY